MNNEPTSEQIDRAAKFLREASQGSKLLNPWESLPKATKKKWLALADGALRAAFTPASEPAK